MNSATYGRWGPPADTRQLVRSARDASGCAALRPLKPLLRDSAAAAHARSISTGSTRARRRSNSRAGAQVGRRAPCAGGGLSWAARPAACFEAARTRRRCQIRPVRSTTRIAGRLGCGSWVGDSGGDKDQIGAGGGKGGLIASVAAADSVPHWAIAAPVSTAAVVAPAKGQIANSRAGPRPADAACGGSEARARLLGAFKEHARTALHFGCGHPASADADRRCRAVARARSHRGHKPVRAGTTVERAAFAL